MSAFAPLPVRIDGQRLDMLLDTGATAVMTQAGEAATHTPQVAGEGTTSYVTTSLLERWHRRHPDWRVVADGDALLHSRLIEVPRVRLGPYDVGPVWFTERADRNFGWGTGHMSWIARHTLHGAIGANVLGRFDLVLDYGRRTLFLLGPPGPDRRGDSG